jgi:hypothetical protein
MEKRKEIKPGAAKRRAIQVAAATPTISGAPPFPFSFLAPKKPSPLAQPKKSLLSNPYLQIFLASVLLYLAIFIYMYASTPPLSLSFSYSEEPLSKNSQVGLAPGDVLTYSASGLNLSAELRYEISTEPGCPIAIIENSQGAYCIDHSGTVLGAKDGAKPNGTLGFFGTWMLAIGPGWKWGENITTMVSNMSAQSSQVRFEDMGAERALGRECRKIRISITEAGATTNLYYWVDSEKRFLVRAISPDGSKIELSNYTR